MDLFEGTEKKLEIIFNGSVEGLRSNRDGRWNRVVRESRAEIISCISSPEMDAYLLTESSLFVWDNRLLMITCGQTTPAAAVPVILDVVGSKRIGYLFFERKNALYPGSQPTDFETDVSVIRDFFQGKMVRLGASDRDHIHVFWSAGPESPLMPDATLQVLMHDLAPAAAAPFSACHSRNPSDVRRLERLKHLYPSSAMDEYFFHPQGYSLNAIEGKSYFTVHVTPQASGSFASFESNIPAGDFERVFRELIRIFEPGRFSVMLTATTDPDMDPLYDQLKAAMAAYHLQESADAALDLHYRVIFSSFVR